MGNPLIQGNTSRQWMLPRREILKRLSAGMALGLLSPGLAVAAKAEKGKIPPSALTLSSVTGESYWELIRQQFPIRPDYIMMNAANLCPTHYGVLEHFTDLSRNREGDVSFQNRAKFSQTKARSRELLAEYLEADPVEIAITRNTSESNNIIIGGLTLGPGDEVLIWDQNHPSNNLAWKLRAQRYGFNVKEFSTPVRPEDPGELLATVLANLSDKTRVFAASHVSNTTGLGLPMQEICHECRQRDILTLVDGAQSFGALALDLHDMGCDFYTGSLHKWAMGPKETGVLYVRKGLADKVWPSIVSVDYAKVDHTTAEKFDDLGQRDDAIVAAVAKAIEFHKLIGKNNVEARMRVIADTFKDGIKSIPGADLLTPAAHSMSAGVIVFGIKGVNGREGFMKLYQQHHIAAAPTGAIDGMRLSPHIYNTLSEVDRVLSALKAIST